MLTKAELQEWLDDLPEDALLVVSDDGRSIEVVGQPDEWLVLGSVEELEGVEA